MKLRMRSRLAGAVKRLNVEHRTPNFERRILMTLRFELLSVKGDVDLAFEWRDNSNRFWGYGPNLGHLISRRAHQYAEKIKKILRSLRALREAFDTGHNNA